MLRSWTTCFRRVTIEYRWQSKEHTRNLPRTFMRDFKTEANLLASSRIACDSSELFITEIPKAKGQLGQLLSQKTLRTVLSLRCISPKLQKYQLLNREFNPIATIKHAFKSTYTLFDLNEKEIPFRLIVDLELGIAHLKSTHQHIESSLR